MKAVSCVEITDVSAAPDSPDLIGGWTKPEDRWLESGEPELPSSAAVMTPQQANCDQSCPAVMTAQADWLAQMEGLVVQTEGAHGTPSDSGRTLTPNIDVSLTSPMKFVSAAHSAREQRSAGEMWRSGLQLLLQRSNSRLPSARAHPTRC